MRVFAIVLLGMSLVTSPLLARNAGETDIALLNSQRTLAVFNNYGVRTFWVMSSNGHEWLNWRRYLYQTAQIMFPEDR